MYSHVQFPKAIKLAALGSAPLLATYDACVGSVGDQTGCWQPRLWAWRVGDFSSIRVPCARYYTSNSGFACRHHDGMKLLFSPSTRVSYITYSWAPKRLTWMAKLKMPTKSYFNGSFRLMLSPGGMQ
jgi:hypothetical protein